MSNFSLQSFMAAQYAGSQLNLESENRKADVQMKQQQIAQGQQQMAAQKQQMDQTQAAQAQMAKLVTQWDQDATAAKVETGDAPDTQKSKTLTTQAGQYRQLSRVYLQSNPQASEAYAKMADSAEGKVTELEAKNLKIGEAKTRDLASYAGTVIAGDQSPEESFAWVKDHMSLKEAMEIPKDPEASKRYWKTKQSQGLTANEQLSDKRKIAEDVARNEDKKEREVENKRHHLASEQGLALQRETLRASTADRTEQRVERLAATAKAAEVKQIEKYNGTVQREAKPLLEDKRRIEDVQDLLRVNSPAADQQVHQALTSVLGNFKGRATNLFYKDNKNFGDVVDRIGGFLSRQFDGRYSEESRKQIADLMTQMKARNIEPALAKLESNAKTHAKGYGWDTGQVEIQGEFDRNAKAPESKAAAYTEGQIAKNPSTGATLVFKQGKWVSQ